VIPGTNNQTHPYIQCFHCKYNSYYSSHCPTKTTSKQHAVGFLSFSIPHHVLQQKHESIHIPSSWVLLDSQSTVNMFHNNAFLQNIRPADHPCVLHTNGGVFHTSEVGDLPNFEIVYYNPASLANILSLRQVRLWYRVTMDTDKEAAILVHRPPLPPIKFIEFDTGLYYHDANSSDMMKPHTNYCMVSTVSQNKEVFNQRDLKRANDTLALYRKCGRPSARDFAHILRNNPIRDCPFTVDNWRWALFLYGPDIATIKGRTIRRRPLPSSIATPIGIPADLFLFHRNVHLTVDFVYIQGLPFIQTISHKWCYKTLNRVDDHTATTITRLCPLSSKPTLPNSCILSQYMRIMLLSACAICFPKSTLTYVLLLNTLVTLNAHAVPLRSEHIVKCMACLTNGPPLF